jgi:hypothetical protein
MSGLNLVLPSSFTDTSLPILLDDPILPVNGALLLADVFTDASAGVPTKLKNIAAPQASTLLNTSEAALDFEYQVLGSITDAQVMTYRTPKRGVQGIVSRVNQNPTQNTGKTYNIPQAILNYLVDHPTNSIFYSVWSLPVNAPTPPQNGPLGVGHKETTSYHTFVFKTGTYPNNKPNSYFKPTSNLNGSIGLPRIDSLEVRSFNNGTTTVVAPPAKSSMKGTVGWGRVNEMNAFSLSTDFSFVFYRLYIEDLTVSGRDFATVSAIDQALHTAAFGAGGKFAADTYKPITDLP